MFSVHSAALATCGILHTSVTTDQLSSNRCQRGQSCTAMDQRILFSDASPKFAVLNVCLSTLSYPTGSVHTPTTLFFSSLRQSSIIFDRLASFLTYLFSFQLIALCFSPLTRPLLISCFIFPSIDFFLSLTSPCLKFQSPNGGPASRRL